MRILIVEDEVHLVSALSEIISKKNYIVDSVTNGQDGLDYALSGVYDVILLDIMLPKLDGLSLLKRLRTAKILTPVLLLTAKDQIADKVKGLDTGADDYLTKPFSSEELLARIRALTRRKGEIADDCLKFADLTLNTKTCQLCGSSNMISLGLKEYQLMELLLINKAQILTKETIIEKIWGFDGDADYNNVEVYISFLRKKLTYIGTAVQIKTIRGIGYRLEAAL